MISPPRSTATAPGAPSGTISPIASAAPICCRSPSPIWISPPRRAFSRRCSSACSTACWATAAGSTRIFLGALRHWYQQRFNAAIDTATAVYGPSVIYMAAQLIRQWSVPGDYVVTHTPAYDAFYKVILANQRQLLACPLQKAGDDWRCDMAHLEALLARPQTKILLLCSPHNPHRQSVAPRRAAADGRTVRAPRRARHQR